MTIYPYACKRTDCPGKASSPGYCTRLCKELDKCMRYTLRRAEYASATGGDLNTWAREWSALLEVAEAVNAWQEVVRERLDNRQRNSTVA